MNKKDQQAVDRAHPVHADLMRANDRLIHEQIETSGHPGAHIVRPPESSYGTCATSLRLP